MSDETYEQMKARIKPERFEVVRTISGPPARMSRGLGADRTEWEEPNTWASIRERATGRVVVPSVNLNSMSLAIPEGLSGKWPRAINATDEEIILAAIGDEPIFPNYGKPRGRAKR
jgi:hypothetical protein